MATEQTQAQATAPVVASAAVEVAERPSVRDLSPNFKSAYAQMKTGRLVTSGPCTVSGPSIDEATGELRNYNGKYKVWLTAVLEARPDGVNIDYITKEPIEAPGAIELYLTQAQLDKMESTLATGFTSGIIIQARASDVAAYDLPSDNAVLAICEACHIQKAELPYVLLIERPASSLNYDDARERRQGEQLVRAGRGHYMNTTQQKHAASGLYGGSAKEAFAALMKS